MGTTVEQPRKTAFACWEDRLAPVFDTAREVLIVEFAGTARLSETRESLPDSAPVARVMRLAELGIGELVCGAISRSIEEMIRARGIAVRPFVAGALPVVIDAWRAGHLDREPFTMPGCGGGRRCAAGRGRGRMDGPRAAGAVGCCVCPACGHREAHERGIPCVRRACPQCGSIMTRE